MFDTHPELYPTLLAIYKEEMEAHAQDNPGWEERDEGDDDEPFASELSAMVVMATLCPKLEKLDAKLGYNEDFFPAQPGSLRKLKHVEVGHSDTEMGMHLNAFWPLAEAAPKLAKLYCTSLASSGPPGFTFANVTELKLAHSGMDADSLHNVLQTFPRLEDFTFEAGGSTVCDEQFTPREAQNALRSAPGLLRLHLDFTEALLHETTDLDEYICSLQSLQHLQDLVLDTRCLIPHRDPFGTSYFRGPDGQMIRTDHAFDDESQLSEMLLNLKDIFSEKDVGFDTAEFPPMMIGFDPEEV
ncbi:unnamed protein product [Parascedosporium putredinis]|uniref:Uncharacterized protein n=1 Tax=Parascedosporium putredinis TaxID=1442378 RepID=A0A9P1H1B6_9PEZI|nr:unnamed protein product [Parascedosporium putredinis]CAI7993580.1 unnamed protein product [Parascedosporium putredinis]